MKARKITYILLIAFLLRIIANIPVFKNEDLAWHNDTISYHPLAENITEGRGYTNCSTAPFYKDSSITPGFPYFLSAVYTVMGVDMRNAVFIQILLDCLICFLLIFIGTSLFKEKIGLLAGLLYAVSSHSLTYTGFILTEVTFATYLILFIAFILTIRVKNKSIFIGLFWGILVLIRPIAILSLPVFIVFFIMDKKRSLKKNIIGSILIAIVGISAILPWMNRNYKLTGNWTISAIKDYNLYAVNATSLKAYEKGMNENEMRKIMVGALESELFTDCSGNYDYLIECKEKGSEIIRNDFLKYVVLHFSYVPNLFLPEVTLLSDRWKLTSGDKGTLAVINKDGLWAGFKYFYDGKYIGFYLMAPLILIWGLVLFFGLFGTYKLIRKEKIRMYLPIFLLLAYFIGIPGPVSNGRFLYPITPYLYLISAYGIISYLERKKRRKTKEVV